MGGMPSATVSAAQRAMTTASSTPDTRQRLLAQGLTLASKVGLRGLSVRGLCQAAGINTGSFVYHFGNRERFAAELIEHWYAPLLGQLQLEFDLSDGGRVRQTITVDTVTGQLQLVSSQPLASAVPTFDDMLRLALAQHVPGAVSLF